MNINIRRAKKEDAEAIAFINSQSALKVYKGILTDEYIKEKFSFEIMRDRLYKELETGTAASIIMYKSDIPVGMMTFAEEAANNTSEINIWRIYLLPEYWGQSLGKELMDWGLKDFAGKGYKKAALWVAEENSNARRFYEKYGFRPDGEIQTLNIGKEVRQIKYVIEL